MPPWRQRSSQQVEVRAFEWVEAGAGTVLLRLLAVTSLDAAGSEPELLVVPGTGPEQRVAPLPTPPGEAGELRLAFPVDAALVGDPESRFELVVDDVPGVSLPFPEAMGAPPPSPAQTDPAAPPVELELETAVLTRKLERLREELHDARRRLGEAEARAEDAYANQVMAEERSFEARARASDTATRLEQVEASLAGAHTEVSELRRAREELGEQMAELERAQDAQESAKQQALAELTDARAALAATHDERAAAEQRRLELEQAMAELNGRLDTGAEERRRLEEEIASLRERTTAAELERTTAKQDADARILELERALEDMRNALSSAHEERERLDADLAEAREQAATEQSEEPVPAETVSDDEAQRLRVELELIQESALRIEAELQRTAADAANARAQGRAAEDELRVTRAKLSRLER